MRFDGVLLASDFDGTLVPDDKRVTPEVRDALRYFIENGGRFTVSTGRTFLGFHGYSPEYVNAPVLLANGGMLYDYEKREILSFDGIGEEGIGVIRAVLRAFPGLAAELYPFERAYTLNMSPESERHISGQGIPLVCTENPADAPRPWAKAMFCGSEEEIVRVQDFLAEQCPEVSFIPSSGRFLEVQKKGVNKGEALLKLADRLGIRREHVYAVGDGGNDLEMLRAARLSFVPENADARALARAGRVVRSNENGAVANVVELLDEIYRTEPAE